MSKLKEKLGEGWFNHLSPFFTSELFTPLKEGLSSSKYYPVTQDVFRAFKMTPWDDVRVVILGKEPYCELLNVQNKVITQATGLALGMSRYGLDMPYILEAVRTEIEKEYDTLLVNFEDTLEPWAEQGVFLLNTALTVEPNNPGSHIELWKDFAEFTIKTLSENKPGLIWMLWGKEAQAYKQFINQKTNHVLECQLSPSEEGWIGNGHFKQANDLLIQMNGPFEIIKWYKTLELDKAPF